MPVRLNSSGGGSVTLDVPTTASAFNLTIPATNGTLVTTASLPAAAQLQDQLFTASGSWTAPTGVTRVYVVVAGGGGGGGGGAGSCNPPGGNGGFGGVSVGIMTVVPGTAYTVTVGAGGSGGVTGTNGVAGNTSSFGALMSATGGARGLASGGGDGLPGSGSGGNLRNLNMSSSPIPPFNGSGFRSGGTAAVAWSTSLANSAGAGGLGGPTANGNGGVNGIVYLQWVG